MDFKTVRESHWFTWLLIVSAILVMALFAVIFVAYMTGHYDIASEVMFIMLLVPVVIALAAIISRLKFTGIIAEGDIHVFKKLLVKQVESPDETKTEISELKDRIKLLRQSIESTETKADNILDILKKVSE